MNNDDILACAQTVQAWGFARDQRRWEDLRDTFHPHGVIHVSWFSGSFDTFVDHCKANASGGVFSKHLLWPSRVRGAANRAISETTTAILVRQVIEDVTVDLTSYARFLDRFERRNNVWRIVERTCIYEFDRLDPLTPSDKFTALMKSGEAERFPVPYRYMGYRIAAHGRALAEPVHYDGRPETEALKSRYEGWMRE